MSEKSKAYLRNRVRSSLAEIVADARAEARKTVAELEKLPGFQSLLIDPAWHDLEKQCREMLARHEAALSWVGQRFRDELTPEEQARVDAAGLEREQELGAWRLNVAELRNDYGLSVAAGKVDEPLGRSAEPERLQESPATPKKYLTNWREILVALGYKNNTEDRGKVRSLNQTYEGPILFPGQGAQPKVEKTKLIDWFNGLEAQWAVGHNKARDAEPTTSVKHGYGRDGTVVPDLSGGEKKRRSDRKP